MLHRDYGLHDLLRSCACSGYEASFKAAQAPNPASKTSEGVVEQQQQMKRMSSLLAAIETLAKQAVQNSATDSGLEDPIKAAEGNFDSPINRPSKDMRTTDGDDDETVGAGSVHPKHVLQANLMCTHVCGSPDDTAGCDCKLLHSCIVATLQMLFSAFCHVMPGRMCTKGAQVDTAICRSMSHVLSGAGKAVRQPTCHEHPNFSQPGQHHNAAAHGAGRG